MADTPLAPASTLLGKLQRGRGAGYRDVLTAPRAEGIDAVERCIVEEFDEPPHSNLLGYAELVRRLDVPLDGFFEHVRKRAQPATDDEEDRLIFETNLLGELARHGHEGAQHFLREQVWVGTNWYFMLAQYHDEDLDLDRESFERVLVKLDRETLGVVYACNPHLPWDELRSLHAPVDRAIRHHEEWAKSRRRQRRIEDVHRWREAPAETHAKRSSWIGSHPGVDVNALEQEYTEVVRPNARVRALLRLEELDPGRARPLAVEMLWDCCWQARCRAIRLAPPGDPVVRERLRKLSERQPSSCGENVAGFARVRLEDG